MKKQFVFILILIHTVCNASGQGFGEHHIVTSGSLPNSINSFVVADVNNDDDPDIFVCSSLREKIYFLENKGNQEFKVLQELEFELGELNNLGAGDLNNDGLIDIVYSYYGYFSQLSWLQNMGDNKFKRRGAIFSFSNGWNTVSFSVQDLNGDNADDIIIGCNELNFDLEVKLNSGYGTFTSHTSLIDEGKLQSYQSSDLENDGDIDIVYISKNPYSFVAAINNGDGEFTEKVFIDPIYQTYVYAFHSFDSDGDSDIDILGLSNSDSLPLFLNNGDNIFVRKMIEKDPRFRIENVKSLDFDNDGDLDLINRYMEVLACIIHKS